MYELISPVGTGEVLNLLAIAFPLVDMMFDQATKCYAVEVLPRGNLVSKGELNRRLRYVIDGVSNGH
jgi:hypothetical protein